MNEPIIIAAADSGVVAYARRFESVAPTIDKRTRTLTPGLPAGYELVVMHRESNHLVERTRTLVDEIDTARAEVRAAATRWIGKSGDDLVVVRLDGCEYEGCKACPPHHRKFTAPQLAVCDSCHVPAIGWLHFSTDKVGLAFGGVGKTIRTCWRCWSSKPGFDPRKCAPAPRFIVLEGDGLVAVEP